MNVVSLGGIVYKSLYTNSKVLESMVKISDMNLDKEYYLKSTLRKYLNKK